MGRRRESAGEAAVTCHSSSPLAAAPHRRAAGRPARPFPASYPLTEAGDILPVPTRGHTFGHLSVIVEPPGEPRLVLAGDASYRQDLMLDGVVDGVAADERAAKETWAAATVRPRAADRVPARPRPGVQ